MRRALTGMSALGFTSNVTSAAMSAFARFSPHFTLHHEQCQHVLIDPSISFS